MNKTTELFKLLDDWRNLPSYQLERRADIFFAVHLEKILKNSSSTLISKNEIMGIIPEFPVFKRLVNNSEQSNQSFKVDYAVFFKNSAKFLLVELKTDMESIDPKQYNDLKKVQQAVELYDIIEGIKTVYKTSKSKYREKYNYLLTRLRCFDILDEGLNFNLELNHQNESELFYLMPDYDKKFKIVPDSETITFDDVRGALSEDKDALTTQFCRSLSNWTRRYSMSIDDVLDLTDYYNIPERRLEDDYPFWRESLLKAYAKHAMKPPEWLLYVLNPMT